jgi:hypothetical protein
MPDVDENPAARPAAGETPATPAAEQPAADQAITAPRPSRTYLWAGLVASLAIVAVAAAVGVPRVMTWFTLPECDATATRNALTETFKENKTELKRLGDLKTVSATRSERICRTRAEARGRLLNLQYRIGWNGWSPRVAITREEAEGKIEPAQLDEVKKAAAEFLDLARDAHAHGRPPRQAEPTIRGLFDKIYDLKEIEGVPLALSEIGKAMAWLMAGEQVGTVYILAGTGVSDINKLPTDPTMQRRAHSNVAEFAGEFSRYLDFQIKLIGIMADAELNRLARGDALQEPAVKQEIAEVRSALSNTMIGALTTLAYGGLTDDWRQLRLTLLAEVAPKASKLLLPEQARAVREHALKIAALVPGQSAQDGVKAVADRVSPP